MSGPGPGDGGHGTATGPRAPGSRRAPGRRASPPGGRGSGRRTLGALALVVPLLCLGSFGLAQVLEAGSGSGVTGQARPPTRTPLTRATVVCPDLEAPLQLSTASGERGRVAVRAGDLRRDIGVRPRRVTEVGGGDAAAGPAWVTGLDRLAPGLVVARFPTSGPPVAPTCGAPAADQWFTGLGAAARHSSVLQLVNPDSGPAVIDTEVLGSRGPVDVAALRGVSVPGRGSLSIDLAQVAPRRGELTLHVTTSRGRVGVAVLDRVDDLSGAGPTADWLASQPAPSTSALLLGVPTDPGTRTLVVANPTASQARAAVSVVGPESVFSPDGAEDVVVPAGTTVRVDLDTLLGDGALDETALGVRVDATAPVTTSVRSVVGGDLSIVGAGRALPQVVTTAVVPAGTDRLVAAGALRTGSWSVTALDADGARLDSQRRDLEPDRGSSIDLPAGTRLVQVRLRATSAVVTATATTDAGTAVLGLRPLETTGLVGDVTPSGG